ncbi:MAG: hypothetical protein H7A12_12885 [Pseudomonadales bacterium]|jgi:hypothetical protein|nr:hypothetical protein [Pseudomonadales bacterium]
MGFRFHCLLATLALTGATATPVQAQGFLDQLKQAVGGNYTVRGRVQLQSGQWLTCFDGNNTGYLGPADLARPGDARTDPATGTVKVTTAAIPTVIMTRGGVVTSNDCDSLAQQGLLVAPTQAGTAARSDTGYNDRDRTGCITPDMTKDYIAAHSNEIIACQARVLTERDAAALQAGQNGAAAAGGTSAEQQQAANARLQQDTAEKFKAIQSQVGVPVTAAKQSDEDMAWDGAKLCNLKPAYMMKLKEEATGFVRYDASGGKIVLSEMSGGARKEVGVDGDAFAQRVSFNAQAIGQGGDTCGRAFWNAEAYKAASAAMSR